MKLPDGKGPRSIADEGFFVGKKPFISKSNINRMESRFVTQKVEISSFIILVLGKNYKLIRFYPALI